MENFWRNIKNSPAGIPFGLRYVDPALKDSGLLKFESHFNADLASDSAYFKSFDAFLKCVEKNAGSELSEAQ